MGEGGGRHLTTCPTGAPASWPPPSKQWFENALFPRADDHEVTIQGLSPQRFPPASSLLGCRR